MNFVMIELQYSTKGDYIWDNVWRYLYAYIQDLHHFDSFMQLITSIDARTVLLSTFNTSDVDVSSVPSIIRRKKTLKCT